MPPWITSELREDTPLPMPPVASATMTSWPARAAARAIARPTTPAPMTRTCMGRLGELIRHGRACPGHDVSNALLRGDPHFRRGRLDVVVDVRLELDEVVLEHAHQLARRLVELGFVLPGLVGIEQV